MLLGDAVKKKGSTKPKLRKCRRTTTQSAAATHRQTVSGGTRRNALDGVSSVSGPCRKFATVRSGMFEKIRRKNRKFSELNQHGESTVTVIV